MTVKILGSGCPNCQKAEQNVQKVIKEFDLKDIKIEHVYDMDKIVEYGVMATPAIVIDEKIMAAGRIPETEEIKGWLKK